MTSDTFSVVIRLNASTPQANDCFLPRQLVGGEWEIKLQPLSASGEAYKGGRRVTAPTWTFGEGVLGLSEADVTPDDVLCRESSEHDIFQPVNSVLQGERPAREKNRRY